MIAQVKIRKIRWRVSFEQFMRWNLTPTLIKIYFLIVELISFTIFNVLRIFSKIKESERNLTMKYYVTYVHIYTLNECEILTVVSRLFTLIQLVHSLTLLEKYCFITWIQAKQLALS